MTEIDGRQVWLGVLATARIDELEAAIRRQGGLPRCALLRRPETGLVMARGRAGGSGRRFNLGEVAVTRCSVQSAAGQVGHGYVQGRDQRHAELAAVLDALLQDPARHDHLMAEVIRPLADRASERKRAIEKKAEATRVEFFTMVRGEG